MARHVSVLVTLLALAPACAADTGGPYLQAGGTDDGGDEGGETGDEEAMEPLPRQLLECELTAPCEFPFLGTGFDADLTASAFSPSDLCVFTSLARGEPGLIETVAEFSDATARLDYAIVSPGVALRQASGESDAGGRWLKGVFRCELQPSAFFLDCLQAPSAACLDPEQWVVGCEPLDNLVCPG
ncbi:hypothetical protein SAMN02745121_03840 [Nannocystis exedens]|uniref:Lipoprotein n=1 Tax=Nannocystis exedens TaxID=54 RepID=A0A1I1ZLR8_9BACT|nr:hypothetical protein [Nannocystis exedens]PCC75434.1 hypothetical protein NAEX_08544 [Nannocystis exedens]SFE32562.1 hypothetical protein SAMN02745121_03840 [Nannocystis exedens]